MPHVGAAVRGSESLLRGATEIGRPAVFGLSALVLRFALLGFVGYLNGISWAARLTWPVAYRALFVVAIAYAIAFVIWKTKAPWLVAGVVCGIVENIISIPYMIQNGTTWQSIAVIWVEWFVVGSIAGLLTMLVPADWPNRSKRKSTYY